MTRTSHPGNEDQHNRHHRFNSLFHGERRPEGGFVLLDALLCLFITGIAALLVHGSIEAAGKAATGRIAAAVRLIEERNTLAGGTGDGPLSGGRAADE
ncbi:MAG: hypothetical protein LBD78_10290 [Spirochaetaceae bacterium]|jgi:hypothetical protein|nr:hypothetical protein [Spirochaetaceae bacterium]